MRRTWGRSHYHPPHTPSPPANPPIVHLFPASPGKHRPLFFSIFLSLSLSLFLSLSIMVNNTLPHSRSVIAKKKKKKKKPMSCRTPVFCCFYKSKNRQDKRKEPKGLSERGRERDKEREIESVNRKGVFGLVFLLRERCCCRGELVFWETIRLPVWENGQTLPCLVKNG